MSVHGTLFEDRFCRSCSYSLRGISSTHCPECGRGFDLSDSTTTVLRASFVNLLILARTCRVVIGGLGVLALVCFAMTALGVEPFGLWGLSMCGSIVWIPSLDPHI